MVVLWPIFVLLLLGVEGLLWQPLTFVLLTLNFLGFASFPDLLRQNIRKEIDQGLSGGSFFVLGPIVYFFSFVLLSRGLWLLRGPALFQVGSELPSMTSWILYGFDHLIRVILFDFPEAFGISLSGIEHEKTFWISLLVFTFRFTLSIAALKAILRGFRVVSDERARAGVRDPFGLI